MDLSNPALYGLAEGLASAVAGAIFSAIAASVLWLWRTLHRARRDLDHAHTKLREHEERIAFCQKHLSTISQHVISKRKARDINNANGDSRRVGEDERAEF